MHTPRVENETSGVTPAVQPFAPKFIIEKVGAKYHVTESGVVGTLSYDDFNVAFNNEAIAGLTAGRTWQEKILIKGECTLHNATLDLMNFLEVEIQGRVVLGLDAAFHLFTSQNTDQRSLHIHGGLLDCNNLEANAIHYVSTYVDGKNLGLYIHDIRFLNMGAWCIYLGNANCATISNLQGAGNGGAGELLQGGLLFASSYENMISNVVLATVGLAAPYMGIRCAKGSKKKASYT